MNSEELKVMQALALEQHSECVEIEFNKLKILMVMYFISSLLIFFLLK